MLIPFDGSSNARRAFEKALSIAQKFDLTIIVLIVP
ncbi:MAG: universal stress protein [Nitrosopumilus sp.]|nr:universal stress protein [Nitrosopumilus sp.]